MDPKLVLLAVLLLALLPLLYFWLPPGDDWTNSFRPAALALLQGESPFSVSSFYNAPWVLVPLLPIALLPFQWSRMLFFLASLAGWTWILRRLTSRPWSILLVLTSAPVLYCLYGGNLDWIAALSFVAPAPLSLVLAATKPQIGAGIMVYWLFESWRRGGARLLLRNFLPVSLLSFFSFLLYGFWPARGMDLDSVVWNAAVFPYLVPIGIFLVVAAVRRRDLTPAMPAGLMISPYFSLRSGVTLLTPLLEQPKLLMLGWLALWVYPVIKFLH